MESNSDDQKGLDKDRSVSMIMLCTEPDQTMRDS